MFPKNAYGKTIDAFPRTSRIYLAGSGFAPNGLIDVRTWIVKIDTFESWFIGKRDIKYTFPDIFVLQKRVFFNVLDDIFNDTVFDRGLP